ncbi:hypothetical protein FHS83_000689 [Rhizomicrobium palustre]|uniref:Uncharacterized protein n=1 Tax=Rhizomicrobium palustre TaxID=189966 RepID=A0A846MW36_9PROT|nr:hypothetical protein [Rhizomicrobium palustre]NIK87371.1 hypothetical protein [Rhizomicrobium palustre]
MRGAAAFRERKEVRSFHKLRRTNSGRVLNLIALSDAATTLNSGPKPAGVSRLFHSNALNYAILTKHNIRDNERELFARNLLVATKIFIPFDPRRLEIGGRSFFIEEFLFKDHLRDLLHMDPTLGDPHVLHDVKILEALSRSPTLDAFIVTEFLRSEGLKVEPTFFCESYSLAAKTSAEVFQVFKPLVQKALGKSASPEEMNRFVDQVWNVSASSTSNLFLEALQIPRAEWGNVIFAWKALIYYDLVSRGTADRLQRVLQVLQGTVTKSRPTMMMMQHIEDLKRELARNLYKLHEGSTGYIQGALRRVVDVILNGSQASELTESLRNMAENISGVGMNVVLFDQVTSYLLYLYPRPSTHLVDAEEFEAELQNLCDIVQLRDTAFG